MKTHTQKHQPILRGVFLRTVLVMTCTLNSPAPTCHFPTKEPDPKPASDRTRRLRALLRLARLSEGNSNKPTRHAFSHADVFPDTWGIKHTPLVFHDEAYGVLHLGVFRSAAFLHLRLHGVSLVLDVLQRVLHQVTHGAVLRRIQRLDVLQDVQDLTQSERQ